MKLISLLLSLLLALPAPMQVCLRAEKTDTLSPGALEALDAVLSQTALTFSDTAYRLDHAGEPLLLARLGEGIACGEAAAPLEAVAAGHRDAFRAARELADLLAPWEQQIEQAVDLQEAGNARWVYAYALTGEEWAQVMSQVMTILTDCMPEAAALAEAQIVGKGTFKRYFDREMNEIGAYFYAQEVHLGEEVREVRLEYGASPKGLYLAFRCPNGKQTRNQRVALHAKARAEGWTLTGEVRRLWDKDSDIYTLSGKTDGTLTLGLSRKAAGKTTEYTLALTPREGGADYAYTRNKHLVLRGTAAWQTAQEPDFILPDVQDDPSGVTATLAGRLITLLRAEAPDTWQQLLHAVSTDVLMDHQANPSGEAE